MALASHIKRRGSTYYVQLGVPLEAQPLLGRKTLDRSLRTKNPDEAKRRAPAVLLEFRATIDAARRGELLVEKLDALAISVAAKAHYDAEIAADDRERLGGIEHQLSTTRTYARGVYANKLRLLAAGLIEGDEAEALIGYAANAQTKDGATLPTIRGTDARNEALRKLAAVRLDALAIAEAKDNGVINLPEPRSQLLREPSPPKEGEGILDLFDRYARENQKGVSADTLRQARRDVALFAETAGSVPAGSIMPSHVADFKDLLLLWPVKAAETKAFRGMTMREIVKANEKVGKPTINARTINRYLSALSSFCEWLRRRQKISGNPCDGLFQSYDKTESEARPFTTDELQALFKAPPFTAALSDEEWRRPGNMLIRDHRFWVPLVMLFSGARPGELAQLRVGDLREVHGTPVMHITTLDEERKHRKTTKTKGSVRVVPTHPELVRLGFLAYRDEIATSGEKRLFPKATQNDRGQWLGDFSRDFNRYLTTLGLKDGRGISLYSFRHGFTDALREAGFLDEEIKFLVGHTKFTTTALYGRIPEGTLSQRTAMVSAVLYSGLDLTHLHPRPSESGM